MTLESDHLTVFFKLVEDARQNDGALDSILKSEIKPSDMSLEDLRLFSAAVEKSVDVKRVSRQLIVAELKKQTQETIINSYLSLIDKEAVGMLERVAEYMQSDCYSASVEQSVFFLKMNGDCYRYLCEFSSGEQRELGIEKSLDFYKRALDMGDRLSKAHPMVLRLVLAYTVLMHDFEHRREPAIQLARSTFNSAVEEIKDSDDCKESLALMQLIRDNVTLWVSDDDEADAVS
ncbi:MAG: 14-3-3 family protein [Pseudomonas sp.]